MQVKCVSPFAGYNPGDVVEVPDGSEVSPQFFVPVTAEDAVPEPAPADEFPPAA